jgi:putative addiction module CopG family antidote
MSTLSVPVSPEMEKFIKRQVAEGKAENKAQVVRRALKMLEEEEAIRLVLESENEVRKGKIIRGDLRKIIKKLER